MTKEQYRYMASCPICGRTLFRGTPNSETTGNCPKCGKDLVIEYLNNGIRVTVMNVIEDFMYKEKKLNTPKR